MITQKATAAGSGTVAHGKAAPGPERPDRRVTERAARSLPGIPMLALAIVLLLAGVALLVLAAHESGAAKTLLITLGILLLLADAFVLPGLFAVVPGQARVVQLFGQYRGTIRDSGLHWVNPFTRRIAVSTRIRNQESAQAKVNDAMLRQQQASAVVGARSRIVEGAVGMVKLALERLQEEGVLELDEERKAAMVSNLLVVLCSEQATQQVVNTGSLYQ